MVSHFQDHVQRGHSHAAWMTDLRNANYHRRWGMYFPALQGQWPPVRTHSEKTYALITATRWTQRLRLPAPSMHPTLIDSDPHNIFFSLTFLWPPTSKFHTFYSRCLSPPCKLHVWNNQWVWQCAPLAGPSRNTESSHAPENPLIYIKRYF